MICQINLFGNELFSDASEIGFKLRGFKDRLFVFPRKGSTELIQICDEISVRAARPVSDRP